MSLSRLAMFQPLKHRDFRLLWIGQSVSMLGNGIYSVALPFQIIQLGGSPLQLGTGFTIFSTAQLLTVLFGGAIVDRVPRRRVILASDAVSAVVVGGIAALGFAHHLEILDLYVASAFFGAAFSFYSPAMSAIMPELVPSDVLVPGNALRGLSDQSARVFGPLVGGLVVSSLSPPGGFAIDAVSFAVSFAVFSFARPPAHEPPPRTRLLADIREGFAFTLSVPWLWVSIVGFAVTNGFFFAGFSVALPFLVVHALRGGAAMLGLIGAAAGVGEVTGGLLVGNMRIKKLGAGVYLASGLLGVGFAGYGIVPKLPVVLVAAFAFAAAIVFSNTLWASALQKHVPRRLMGRVHSVDDFGSILVAPAAPIVAGAIIGRIGAAPIFLVGGLISLVYWFSALAALRSVRELE